MMTSDVWIDLHDACVIWMTAVIWLVQVLIYPNFRFIEAADFKRFHKRHCDRITIWVSPMFFQVFSLSMIFMKTPYGREWWFHLGAIALIYTTTAFFSVRFHNQLSNGKDGKVIDQLVFWNWPRTLLWSAELFFIILRRFPSE